MNQRTGVPAYRRTTIRQPSAPVRLCAGALIALLMAG
jgi:hypothetical protein